MRARTHGVKLVVATDRGYDPTSKRLTADFVSHAKLGIPVMEVIKAVTSRAAECMGIQTRTGAIQTGLEADLIVVRQNPLENAGAIEGVVIVINDGRVVKNKL